MRGEGARGCDVDALAQQGRDLVGDRPQWEQAPGVDVQVDEQVDVGVRAVLAACDGAEDPDVGGAVPVRDARCAARGPGSRAASPCAASGRRDDAATTSLRSPVAAPSPRAGGPGSRPTARRPPTRSARLRAATSRPVPRARPGSARPPPGSSGSTSLHPQSRHTARGIPATGDSRGSLVGSCVSRQVVQRNARLAEKRTTSPGAGAGGGGWVNRGGRGAR